MKETYNMLAKNANVKYRIDINAIEAAARDDPMGKKKNSEVIENVARDSMEEPRRSLRNKSNNK